jgi:hypothetical protein
MCLTCGCNMPHTRHKPGDIVWEDLVKAGKNHDLTPDQALRNLDETAKRVKR